jgi:hypothetical protein
MRNRIILSVVLLGFSLGAQAAPMTPAECIKAFTQCRQDRSRIFEVATNWAVYKDCLMPHEPVVCGCRQQLHNYIKAWNKFVDHCNICAAETSPLRVCQLYDQNMVCPPKLVLNRTEDQN